MRKKAKREVKGQERQDRKRKKMKGRKKQGGENKKKHREKNRESKPEYGSEGPVSPSFS